MQLYSYSVCVRVFVFDGVWRDVHGYRKRQGDVDGVGGEGIVS